MWIDSYLRCIRSSSRSDLDLEYLDLQINPVFPDAILSGFESSWDSWYTKLYHRLWCPVFSNTLKMASGKTRLIWRYNFLISLISSVRGPRHVVGKCETRLIHMCDKCDMTHSSVWCDSFICVTRLVHVTWLIFWLHRTALSGIKYATWLIHICDMIRSCVLRNSPICVTWLVHVTWLHCTARSGIKCATWLIHICNTTRSGKKENWRGEKPMRNSLWHNQQHTGRKFLGERKKGGNKRERNPCTIAHFTFSLIQVRSASFLDATVITSGNKVSVFVLYIA